MSTDATRIRNVNRSQVEVASLFDKLSSGKRITKASDDAAGLAIANSLAATVSISGVGKRNIADADSALKIADGALGQLNDIGGRLGELAAQASNGTLSDSQRTALNQEFQQLSQEAQRITSTTQFNGTKLISGESLRIQAGTDGSSDSQVAVNGTDTTTLTNDLSSLSVATAGQAASALDSITSFITNVSSTRGTIGAVGSRLESASTNLDSLAVNSAAARSRIEDVDVADSVAQLTAASIRLDAGTALKAQANLSKESVLKLLN